MLFSWSPAQVWQIIVRRHRVGDIAQEILYLSEALQTLIKFTLACVRSYIKETTLIVIIIVIIS